jgi:DNA-binding LacI/PurR family transcriptional regulator
MGRRSTGRPTLNDVALRSGLSNASVSHVLNERSDKPVSDATRERVLKAAAELGYVRNTAAATLRRGHSNLVLLVPDVTFAGEVSARTIEKISAGISGLGYPVLVHTLTPGEDAEERLFDAVREIQPLAVVGLTFLSPDTRARLRKLGARFVTGYDVPPGETEESMRTWETAIGGAQVRHLVERGHRRIAFLMPVASPRLPVARSRLLGVRAACADEGLDEPVVCAVAVDRRAIAGELPGLRSAGVTAVCAHEDLMGIAVLAAMADLGWAAPHDLAVVGADNSPESVLTSTPLTTVAIPDADYGPQTRQSFLAMIEADDTETDLGPSEFAALREQLPDPQVHLRATT